MTRAAPRRPKTPRRVRCDGIVRTVHDRWGNSAAYISIQAPYLTVYGGHLGPNWSWRNVRTVEKLEQQ